MKTVHFVLTILFFFSAMIVQGQNRLANSKRGSVHSYIYTISSDDFRKVHLKDVPVTEDMLQVCVAEFAYGESFPVLERGNYIIVKAVEENLSFTAYTEDDLYFKMVPSEHVIICLYDSLGNIINDAVVKYKGHKLSFDKKSQTYNRKSVKDESVIEINNKGVYHYIEIDKYGHYGHKYKSNGLKTIKRKANYFWRKLKRNVAFIFLPDTRDRFEKYTGFIVFSKPIYKPGEVVKFKAYMHERSGKFYNKPVEVRLSGHYPFKVDTVLTTLKPYRPGMYEYQFTLSDSLNLKLDASYRVELQDKNRNYLSESFRYEDYELKSIKFSMNTGKEKYIKGDSVKINFNVSDENDLAVYDGRIDVLILPERFNEKWMNKQEAVFIPDTLWKHTIEIDGVPEKELIVPDSIFPAGISLDFTVNATYLSADNEKRTQVKRLSRNPVDYTIDFSLSKGVLAIKEFYKGNSQPIRAEVLVAGENKKVIYKDSVLLPYSLSLPWLGTEVRVSTQHTSAVYFIDNKIQENQLGYRFYRSNDSVYLKVDNPAQIPFWYTVQRMNKEIASGYTTSLDYSVPDKGKKGYSMQLKYLFGEERKTINGNLPFAERNISMDIATPTSVYPGQTTDVLVSVTDKKGNPVKDVDITAYSITSKFERYSAPQLRIQGKAKYAKGFSSRSMYDADEHSAYNQQKIEWDKWKHSLALDTIEYYKFLYPDTFYGYQQPTTDGGTFIAPYVVIDGVLQGIQMLWIDEQLYYFKEAQHLNPYLFPVTSGRHNLRFRTYDRDIQVHNVYVGSGKKHIFSFNASRAYQRIQMEDSEFPFYITSTLLEKEDWGRLTDDESGQLSSQLITVDNNFGKLLLPARGKSVDLAAYVKSGNMIYYLNHEPHTTYSYALRSYVNAPILAGPFPFRGTMNGVKDVASLYVNGELVSNIGLEGGNRYTLYKNYQKLKSWDKAPYSLTFSRFKPEVDFNVSQVTRSSVRQLYQEKLNNALSSYTGAAEWGTKYYSQSASKCRLTFFTGEAVKDPVLVYIKPQEKEKEADYHLYYGGTRQFSLLPAGELILTLVFGDSTSYSRPVTLYPNGHTYVQIDSVSYEKNSILAGEALRLFYRNVKKEKTQNPYINNVAVTDNNLMTVENEAVYKADNFDKGVVTGLVVDIKNQPIYGAAVVIPGTTNGTVTDLNGRFVLSGEKGDKIEFAYIGYEKQSVDYKEGHDYRIVLKEDAQLLGEVVVVGYGTTKKVTTTGAVSTIDMKIKDSNVSQALQGYVPGILTKGGTDFWIRGTNTSPGNSQPLILINGVPFEGSLEDLDMSAISSFNVLKDASATAVYGARGANGVIMIEMDGFEGNKAQPETKEQELAVFTEQSSIRRNFHDDAFWQPRLKTNEKGEASFQVTYPDDITRWNAYFLAVGTKKQTDKKELSIRSFKTLTARLSLPRFVIRGDSLNAVGRITNHLRDSIQVQRSIQIGDAVQKEDLNMVSSYVDYIPVQAVYGDSLSVTYSLSLTNGYFDGEERSIPVLEQGLLQTHGDFKIINDTATHSLQLNSDLGEITFYAEASSVELFLREIDKVGIYPYMCNEQMASKVKVLLSKKRIAQLIGKDFKEDKNIKELIARLQKNRNNNGFWGWWNRDKTEFWISRHIAQTLLDAKSEGYAVNLNEDELRESFYSELKKGMSDLEFVNTRRGTFAKRELLERLVFLKRLHAPIDYSSYFNRINDRLEDETAWDKLKTMHTMSMIGLGSEISIDSLMQYSHTTLTGSLYWSDRKEKEKRPLSYNLLPYQTDNEMTLMVYEILRNRGGYEKEMERIRNYFFESRPGGSWQNTYEASRIIEMILPDMLKDKGNYTEVSMYLNGEKVTDFPYTTKLAVNTPVEVRKEGALPLFVTAYQQAWNKEPEPESSKGFTVQSYFIANKDTVSFLKAGTVTQLEVLVEVEANGEYIQIEVPVPAGCTYDSKRSGGYWKEIHREYFKEKVVIFCNRLSAGKHRFTVELIPRYSGYYSLNPAKAELMYFPVFYGNEEMKTVRIE